MRESKSIVSFDNEKMIFVDRDAIGVACIRLQPRRRTIAIVSPLRFGNVNVEHTMRCLYNVVGEKQNARRSQ